MMHRTTNRALLLLRTTKNLRTAQLLHRVRLRAMRFPPARPVAAALMEVGLPIRPTGAGWPAEFAPLDAQVREGYPSPEQNAKGHFFFLNDQRDLGTPPEWGAAAASRLWRFHLHYMDWAWSFARHADPAWARSAFAGLWHSWERSVLFGAGDAWSPYVASLRAWTLCGTYKALVHGTDAQDDVVASLARHARFLRLHLERDVGGNHLIKNLKALIGLGVFFGNERLVGMASGELSRQLPVQVLLDGGHYERSPSYHCQVLGDLVDIAELMDAAGGPTIGGLSAAIMAMRGWLGEMLMPDGDVPLVNDSVMVGRERLALLNPTDAAPRRLAVLPASGYVVVRADGRLHLVADVGDPCPPELPAHAHADCLSFELAVDGRRVVVDSGTSTYEAGVDREYERSTAAHSTVAVDGADQTEVWGTFRAARLARANLTMAREDGEVVTIVASHDGYTRLRGSPVHQRTWQVRSGRVSIVDDIVGTGVHRIASRIHLSGDGLEVTWSGPAGLSVSSEQAAHATGFGQKQPGQVVTASWEGQLPVTLRAELSPKKVALQGSSTVSDDETIIRDAP